MRRFLGILVLFSLFKIGSLYSQSKEVFIDSIIKQMTVDELIGQTLMIRAHSNLGSDHIASVKKLIEDYRVGSLCFFQGTPERQFELTAEYQKLTDIPLMVAMDAEWGLGMRFKKDGFSFPRQLTLGAMQDEALALKMGEQIGLQLRSIGVHLNFAPVVDVNNNRLNPVINDRSFGENKNKVAQLGVAYMKGLQRAGVAACAKHFPGHGDTDTDSHLDLPVIRHSIDRLNKLELFPFIKLVENNVASVMTAHLHIPAIDPSPNLPTSLSSKAINGILREQLNFQGVVISDAMEMKGVTKHFPAGKAEVLALKAGNDIICLPSDVPKAASSIQKALQSGELSIDELKVKVKRILTLKYQLGLFNNPIPASFSYQRDIDTIQAQITTNKIFESSITCLKNESQLIPIRRLENKTIGALSIGAEKDQVFHDYLEKYTRIIDFSTDSYISDAKEKQLIDELKYMDVVIVSFHNMSKYASKNYGIKSSSLKFLSKLSEKTQVIVVLFGSPYATDLFQAYPNIVVAYQDNPWAHSNCAQMLFGAKSFQGKIPVGTKQFAVGSGITLPALGRLKYCLPEEVGLSSEGLQKIDSLAIDLVKEKAAPGCQILVAKDGAVAYQKTFGYHTYKKSNQVVEEDIYDLASLTKVASTTLAIMKLHELGTIDINNPISDYLPFLVGSNKEDLKIRDIMSHRAGLKAWIPFYKNTVEQIGTTVFREVEVYSSKAHSKYKIPVAKNIFLNKNYVDTIYEAIKKSPLGKQGEYVYSDLGMILLGRMVQEVDGRNLQEFMQEEFYRPLGMVKTSYLPIYLNKTPIDIIPPTEEDNYFRSQRIQGYVHDMGAAMLGGIAGHAGLFSNTNELAILFQMLLNGGQYGGRQFLKPETIRAFTTKWHNNSRRGIGFDMKETRTNESMNMSEEASALTFGHLGFTGIAAWADPKNNCIFIFLSNRTYPSMNNKKLAQENYRPLLQEAMYKAFIKDQSSS